MQSNVSLKLEEISKIYVSPNDNSAVKAVDAISLDIMPGEFVTLLGPSGCGKTTTLRMIAGFEIPTSGKILLGEKDISSLSPDKRDTAMVFQSYAIFPHLNIWDNIAYGLKMKNLSKAIIREKVEGIISLVGLEGMEKRWPSQISGGQQQRVALARALVMEPGVLLFDEPLSNLDAKLRVNMRTEIRRIQKKVGITAVYVTHDQVEAMSLSDRIIIMNKGIIEQIGTPKEIYYQPASNFAANFIGEANILDARIMSIEDGNAKLEILGVEVSFPYSGDKRPGENCSVLLRPESLDVNVTGRIPAKVSISTFMGNCHEYHLSCGDLSIRVEINNPRNKMSFSEGDDVMIDFDENDLHII